MRTIFYAPALVTLVALGTSGCKRDTGVDWQVGGDAAAGLDAGGSRGASAANLFLDGGPPHGRLVLPCRAIAVQGTPTITTDTGAHPLAMNDLAAGWVTLGAADSFTAKLPRSAREVGFVGPAMVSACVAPDEAWVARGRFQGARGQGEAPGAEEWVVTPFAVVRYGAAVLEVQVDSATTTVSLKTGSATVLTEASGAWEPLEAGTPRVVKGTPLVKPGNLAATARCTNYDTLAKGLEDALQAPGAASAPNFGDLAMRATDARQLARAACAIAKLRPVASVRP